MREIAGLEIKGLICIALGVSSTRYPVALTRRQNLSKHLEISGRVCGQYVRVVTFIHCLSNVK